MTEASTTAPLPESVEASVYELCLQGGDVAAALQALCAANPMHAAAIAALARSVRAADTAIDLARVTVDDVAPALALLPGTAVGPYVILREIGRGGFGVVYLAEQQQPVRRQVALKVLSPLAAANDLLARFLAERQVLAQLDHPGIARILDAGVTAQGQPFFAMEFLVGAPVTEVADLRRLSIDGRLQLFLQICAAVQHAHQRGVIHRDLKPGNILVAEREGQLEPKIIDFGLAKVLRPETGLGAPSTTEIGRLLGTPEYMSPEQAIGGAIDTRTDVWSLGAILYELLCGRLPFPSPQLRAQGLASVVRVLTEVEPSPPSAPREGAEAAAQARATTAAELQQRIRGDLDLIVGHCLEHDRERRYPGVAELAADVRRHLDHEPVSVGPPGLGYTMAKFVRRHRAGVASAAVAAVALLVGAVVTVWSLFRVTDARDLALAAAAAADRQAYAAAIAAAAGAGEACRADTMRTLLASAPVGERNFEWSLLAAQTEDAEQVMASGVELPAGLAVLGDRAVVTDQLSLRMVETDLRTGRELRHFAHPWQICAAAASHDGRLVAFGGAGGHLDICAADSLLNRCQPATDTQLIQGLAFAPDDSWVLAAATDALAGFDTTTGEPLFRLPGNGSLLWAVDVAADGDTLASGDNDGRVRVWSRARGECLCVLPHPRTVRQVRFHPGGRLLATAARDGRLRLWSIPDGRLLAEQDAHAAVVHGLAYSADGATLVSTQSDGSVRWWNGNTLADLGAGRGHAAYVADVRCLPDGRVLTAAWDGTLRLWPAQPRKRHRPLTGMMGTCAHLALHPRENWLLAASLGGEAAAWDLDDGRCRWSRQFGAGMCQGLALHSDGVRAFVSCDDGRLFAVNAADGAVAKESRPVPGRALHDLQLRRRGDELVVALAEGDLVVVDAATLRCKRHLGDPDPTTRSFVFMLTLHPDDRLATVDIPDAPLRTFDLDTGTLLWERDDIHAACSACAPDGSALYVGDEQGFIRDLDPRTGVERRHFGTGRSFFAVHSLRVAADGRRMVSADQQIRIFDLHEGMELLSLDGDRYDPGVVLIEPARGVMVTGGGYFTDPAEVMVWPLMRAARSR